jgi:hypothetical protein
MLRFTLVGLVVIPLGACGDSTQSDAKVCGITGTSVNIGSTTGGNFPVDLGGGHNLFFNNTNLNFSGGTLADVGAKDCLANIPPWPGGTATVLAQIEGDGYSIQFSDLTHGRFIAGRYDGATVPVVYQYPY